METFEREEIIRHYEREIDFNRRLSPSYIARENKKYGEFISPFESGNPHRPDSAAVLMAEIRENKRKQAKSIIRRCEREQAINRRHYPINIDMTSQRFVRTHYDSEGNLLDTNMDKEDNMQQDNSKKAKSHSLTKVRKSKNNIKR